MAEAASAQQVQVDWRRLATDKNVAIDVARGLWEQAKASQPSDAVARSNLFRRLIDDAARNPGATQDPGKSTLVAASGPADPASLGPGKTTRVLLDQNPSPAAPQEQAGAEPARPSGAAPGQLPGAPGVDPAKPPPTAPPTVAKLRDELVAAAQASQDAVALLASAEPATIVDALRQLREGSPGLLQKVLTAAGAAIERRLGQAAPAPETQPDGPPGIRVPFLGGEGDVHTHFMSDAGVPMVSTPEPVAQKVAEWRADILKREPADQQEVMPSLARATSLDMTAGDQAKQAKLGDEPAKAALPDTQRQLAATLGTVSRQVHTAAQKASTPPSPPPAAPTATAPSGATAATPAAAANANEPTTTAPSPAPTTEASAAPADSTPADPAAAAATPTSAPAPTAAPMSTAESTLAATSTPAAETTPAAAPTSTAEPTPALPTPAVTSTPATSTPTPAATTAGGPDVAAAPAAVPPVPVTYDAYATHVRAKFAGDIGELARMAQESVASGANLKRATQRFELTLEQVSNLKAEFEAIKAELSEKKRRAMQAQIAAQESALPNAGMTMPQLLDKAKELCQRIELAGEAARSEKTQLEGVMNASIMLGMQIDPVAGEKGRDLYFRIDTQENPALVAQARAAGMPEAEVAAMAVNHRNWLRQFVRTEVMQDQNHAEILFLRDLGLVGARTGLTLEQVMAKVIAKLQKPDPETKQAALRADFKLETATPAELDLIYAGVIGSAGTTNAGVNANSGTGASASTQATAAPAQLPPATNTPATATPLSAPAAAQPAASSPAPASSAAPVTPSAAPAIPTNAPASPVAAAAPSAASSASSATATDSASSAVASAEPTAAGAEPAVPSTVPPAPSDASPASTAAPAAGNTTVPTEEPAAPSTASAAEDTNPEATSTAPTEAASTSPAPTAAQTAAVVSPPLAEAAPTLSAAATAPVGPEAPQGANDAASTHTPVQSKAEIASVTSTPIEQGKGEPAAKLVITDPPELAIKTDTPDPIRLKNEVVVLTKAYLALDKQEPAPSEDERNKALNAIKLKFEELRVAMTKARGETDENHLTLARVKFEKFLGVKATSEWDQGTKCVEKMAIEAKNMILVSKNQAMVGADRLDAALKALPEKQRQELGGKLGIPTNIGFAGAVTTDFNRLVDTLTGGSLVQKAQTLINFGERFLAQEVLKGSGSVYDRVAENVRNLTTSDSKFDLASRLKECEGLDAKKQYKTLFASPEFRAKLHDIEKTQNSHVDAERQAEATAAGEGPLTASKNPGENTVLGGAMDSKIPQQPVELLNETQLKFLSQQGQPAVDLKPFETEPDPEKRRQLMIKALKAAGIHLSKAPGVMSVDADGKPKLKGDGAVDATSINEDAVKATVDQITIENNYYIEGKLENIVDPKALYIKNAVANNAPLKAGISGTTARFVGCAQMLGGSMDGAAVAMIGHLQAIEAHSFWEIVDAAGLGMTAGVYVPFRPNPGGMTRAGAEFAKDHMAGIELGPQDAAEKQQLLLGIGKNK